MLLQHMGHDGPWGGGGPKVGGGGAPHLTHYCETMRNLVVGGIPLHGRLK